MAHIQVEAEASALNAEAPRTASSSVSWSRSSAALSSPPTRANRKPKTTGATSSSSHRTAGGSPAAASGQKFSFVPEARRAVTSLGSGAGADLLRCFGLAFAGRLWCSAGQPQRGQPRAPHPGATWSTISGARRPEGSRGGVLVGQPGHLS